MVCFSLGSDEREGRELLNEPAVGAHQQEEVEEEEGEGEGEAENDVSEEHGVNMKDCVETEPPGIYVHGVIIPAAQLCLCA